MIRFLRASLLSAGIIILFAAPMHAQTSACQFILGFKTLHDMDVQDVGDCTDNQAFAPNGDAQQHTTKGLMAWRKADNWTAFTNGYMTWINGPQGLASRLNTARFPWEADASASAPAAAAPASAAPSQTFGTFSAGTLTVGKDIGPGTYRTRAPGNGCYWARLSGFGGNLSDIIQNNLIDATAIVTILPTDKGFESHGCATWTTDLSPLTASPSANLGDGDYFVGSEVAPGTWRAPGGTGCYWQRMSDFTGGLNSIIANGGLSAGPVTVTIAPSDKGFSSHGCGGWSKAS